MCQSRKISHTRDEDEEVEKEKKKIEKREFITHFTEK